MAPTRVDAAAAAAARRAEAERQARIEAERRAEAARRAAEQRRAAEAAKAQQARARGKDEFADPKTKPVRTTRGGDSFEPGRTKDPEAEARAVLTDKKKLVERFPDLKNKKDADLERIQKNLADLKDGDVPTKLKAVAGLAKDFPKGLEDVAKAMNVKDKTIQKIVKSPDAVAAVGTLVDPKSSVADKAVAALKLGHHAGEIFKDPEVSGALTKVLGGTRAAQTLVNSISTFVDPEASAVDKAKAAFDLAKAAKDFAGDAFPQLAEKLGKLDGTMKVVGSALTLLDPNASLKDKALAVATIGVELKDLKKDLSELKDLLKQHGVTQVDEVITEGTRLAAATTLGITPEVAQKLSPAQLAKVTALAEKEGVGEALPKVLGQVKDPAELDALLKHTEDLDPKSAKAFLETLGTLEPKTLQGLLGDGDTLGKLSKLAKSLPDESKATLGAFLAKFDGDNLKRFVDLAGKVDPAVLAKSLEFAKGADGKLIAEGFKWVAKILDKVGVEATGKVAVQLLSGLGKIIPVAGGVLSGIDAVKFFKESADTSLDPNLRYFALTAGKLNTLDTVGAVIEATGIGNVDAPVQIALGVAELAMGIAFDAEKAKFEQAKADGKPYEAPGWMKAVNIASAVAQGPQGLTELALIYGPEGAAELLQDGVKAGMKGAIALGEQMGMTQAELAGDTLKAQGALMHQLADVIRNPSKYGERAKQLAQDAAKQLDAIVAKGGELAKQAQETLGQAVDAAKKLGEKGVETLAWIAENPGTAAKLAVDGLQSLANQGLALADATGKALYKKAVETLGTLKAGWETLSGAAREQAKALIDGAGKAINDAIGKAVELGDKAIDLVAWAATNPGDAGKLAREKLNQALAAGGEAAKRAWTAVQSLGVQGAELAKSALESLKNAGAKGVEILRFAAENPGEAAEIVQKAVGDTLSTMVREGGAAAQQAAEAVRDFIDRRMDWAKATGQELLKDGVSAFTNVLGAWKTNLSEGGKEFISGLADLGDAGADALNDIAKLGGPLAEAAVQPLKTLAEKGNQVARDALEGLSKLPGEVGRAAGAVWKGLGDVVRDGVQVGPVRLDPTPWN